MISDPAVRILIVDDHAMVRLALSEAIDQHDGLELVGEAENSAKAIELYRELQPDVVTMDYQLPGMNGDEVIAAIREEFPEARIVLLSIYDTEESLWRAVEAGALGFVSKAVEINEMIAAIREVARGVPFYSEGLEEKLEKRRTRDSLSPRELDVVRLLVKGCSNKEIEVTLELSQSTVKHHLANAFTKLGVQDRTQASTVAVKRGIVDLG
tara:strand:- start:106 stop:738 length:633 start_codon:yes stop_codon:yes gene_type:complete